MKESVQIEWNLSKTSPVYMVEVSCFAKELMGKTVQLRIMQTGKSHTTPGTGSLTGWESAYEYVHLPQNVQFIWGHFFEIITEVTHITLPCDEVPLYNYQGKYLNIELKIELVKDEQVILSIPFETWQDLALKMEPPQKGVYLDLLENDDQFDTHSFKALLSPQQKKLLLLFDTGLFFFLPLFSFFALPNILSVVYSEHPTALIIFIIFILILLASIARQSLVENMALAYCKLESIPIEDELSVNSQLLLSDLFKGISRVELENVTVKLYAYNKEQTGFMTINSEYNRRHFQNQSYIKNSLIYSKKIDRIPANTPIEDLFNDPISFKPLFKQLYPPLYINEDSYLSINLKLQLKHPSYKDIHLDFEKLPLNTVGFYKPKSEV